MTVDEILRGIRYKQKDNNEVLYSDYDVLNAINEAIRYINQSYAMKNSDFLEKIQPYHIADMNRDVADWNKEHPDDPKDPVDFSKGVDLPDDFLTVVSIRDTLGHVLKPCPADLTPRWHQYKIVGNKLYLSRDANLLYRYVLGEVTIDDTIDLPRIFYDPLVKVAGMILANQPDTDVMMQEINTIVDALIPARRYAHLDPPMPWRI